MYLSSYYLVCTHIFVNINILVYFSCICQFEIFNYSLESCNKVHSHITIQVLCTYTLMSSHQSSPFLYNSHSHLYLEYIVVPQ